MSAPHRMDPDYRKEEETSGHMKSAKTKALKKKTDKSPRKTAEMLHETIMRGLR